MREQPSQKRPAAWRFIRCLNVLLVRLQRFSGQNVNWDRLQKAFRIDAEWATVRVNAPWFVFPPGPPAPLAEPEGPDLLFLQEAVGEMIASQWHRLFRQAPIYLVRE